MLTRAIDLEHRAGGIRVFGFQPGTTDTDMQVAIRASGINPDQQDPSRAAHPGRGSRPRHCLFVHEGADDLAGKEFSLRDDDFRRRIGLAG